MAIGSGARDSLRTVIEVPGAEQRADEVFAVYGDMHLRDSHVVALDADPRQADQPLPDGWDVRADAAADFNERVESVVAAARAEAGAQREVHLIGVGLGAGICVSAAARCPGAVTTLTAVAGWVSSDRLLQETIDLGVALWESDPLMAQRYSSLLEHSSQYRWHSGAIYDPRVPAVPVADARVLRRLNAAHQLDITEDAAAVECPTLVIAPLRDLKVPPQHSHQLYGAIDGAALLEVDAGHGIINERVGQVYTAQHRLMRGHVRPRTRLAPDHA